jgi:hypothetical protein
MSPTRFAQQDTQLSKFGQESKTGKDGIGFSSCISIAYAIGVVTRKWSVAIREAYRKSSTGS